jgi:hypothetical protein
MTTQPLDQKILDAIDVHDPTTTPAGQHPTPTMTEPSVDELSSMMVVTLDTETTDGCIAEPDGVCEHGHPSWLIVLHYI